jgi:AraC-like DNA-binding protein
MQQSLSSRAAVTPMAFVRAILLAYQKYGMDPAAALDKAHIASADVQRIDACITAVQMETISAYAMQELDDEALGWFSRKLGWGSYGMLSRASITAPNLHVALKRWCRHHGLLVDDIGLSLDVAGGVATLAIEERRDLGVLREFCLVSCLRNVHGVACWMADSQLPLLQVDFPFAAPAHAAVYPLLFPGAVRFGAAHTSFSLDAQYLALPLRRDEKALAVMLRRALPLVVLQYRRDRLLAQRVKQLLLSHPAAFTHAEAIAAELQMSVRSLHRQLQAEGSSLQSLKDEARRDYASGQLLRTAKSVKQIALAAGFTNEKSFSRAFKAWTGRAPAEFRLAGT